MGSTLQWCTGVAPIKTILNAWKAATMETRHKRKYWNRWNLPNWPTANSTSSYVNIVTGEMLDLDNECCFFNVFPGIFHTVKWRLSLQSDFLNIFLASSCMYDIIPIPDQRCHYCMIPCTMVQKYLVPENEINHKFYNTDMIWKAVQDIQYSFVPHRKPLRQKSLQVA